MDSRSPERLLARMARLNAIGVALSAEKDIDRLLETILLGAREITGADGGTLYTVSDDGESLNFAIIHTESLGFAMGGSTGRDIPFEPLPLYREDGSPNDSMVATCAAVRGITIATPDAYAEQAYDFTGTRAFDRQTGYRSTSFLTVPLRDHEDAIIAVLQLLNKQDDDGRVIPFDADDRQLVESLASQAAVALTNRHLIDDLQRLFESFIELIAGAIDAKSPYTGGHCRRVPELTLMFADTCARVQHGPLADFTMSEADRYELKIAGWLHDCGKVTTPEHVVDKSTKLETIFDRVHLLDTRFEVLKRDARIAYLQRRFDALESGNPADATDAAAEYTTLLAELDAEREFLRTCNIGGEFMDEAARQRVRDIATRRWIGPDGAEQPLLTEDEVYNLTIPKGTLTPEERAIINRHIDVTIEMLEALPFPKGLQRVPEFAGGHHERMDGKGYPRGLTREQLSVQARIMGIADIFEALTARDRPYKEGKKLSETLHIMGRMMQDGHIDPDLFRVFVEEGVHRAYAERFLEPAQIDEVDWAAIPGFEH
ncbi:MAG: HD domain-containing phosphohydrolase [Ectothiorhodospiraceae bacterium]|jgi:HD-GYP domain-containing protein (c-di-GMP phosphodiesterase class II)|nr:HD domain-containing phosphohydrolase [Ectothiorhodospiraceae bacterium]